MYHVKVANGNITNGVLLWRKNPLSRRVSPVWMCPVDLNPTDADNSLSSFAGCQYAFHKRSVKNFNVVVNEKDVRLRNEGYKEVTCPATVVEFGIEIDDVVKVTTVALVQHVDADSFRLVSYAPDDRFHVLRPLVIEYHTTDAVHISPSDDLTWVCSEMRGESRRSIST